MSSAAKTSFTLSKEWRVMDHLDEEIASDKLLARQSETESERDAIKLFKESADSQQEDPEIKSILPYSSNRNMIDLLEDFGPLPDIIAKAYFHQLLDILENFQSKMGTIHEHITPENILVDSSYKLTMRIALDSKLGVPNHDGLTVSSGLFEKDIFALGVTLFILVTGNRPFDKSNEDDELYSLLINGEYDEFWEFHEELRVENYGFMCPGGFYRQSFRDLMNYMLTMGFEEKSGKAWSIAEIRNQKWCSGIVLDELRVKAFMEQVALKKKNKIFE